MHGSCRNRGTIASATHKHQPVSTIENQQFAVDARAGIFLNSEIKI
jgi:hypothetical protein